MSNAVTTFNPLNLPTFARERKGQSELSKALAGGGGGGGFPHRISIKGGVWRLVASGKEVAQLEERYLDVVVVNAAEKISRTWYAKQYAEGEAEASAPPACWSSNGDLPDENVAPANKQAPSCATCPQNIAGSGQGQMKACRYNQRLAVVLANDIEGDIMQIVLPAKSLFGKEEGGNFPLQAYARWLSAQNIEPNEVITRMKFDTTAESPKVFFKTMRWLTNDEHEIAIEKGATPSAKEAVKLSYTGNAGTVASRNAEFESPKAPALAAPAEDPPAPAPKAKRGAKKEAEAPAPEPTVRKQPETPTLPDRPALSSIVSAWDADD